MRALEATARLGDEPARLFPVVIGDLAAQRPDKQALLSKRETLTFGALAARMNGVSRWALAEGIAKGDVICLLMPNRPEFVAIWLGLIQVGAVVALLNTNLAGAALAHCIQTASPRHIIVAGELCKAYEEAALRLTAPPKAWLHGKAALAAPRLDVAIQAFDGAALSTSERRHVTLADRALLIYTSGTTGLPKAAHVSHHRIMMWSRWFAGVADIGPNDRMYDCLPLYHSVGGVVAIGAALVNGGSAVIAERFSAQRFWEDVVAWDCTLFQYIGELCRYLAAAPAHRLEKAHRLRLACGNGMTDNVWTAFQERFAVPRVLEFYAATEANFSLTNVEGKVGAIGRVPGFLVARNTIALVRLDVDTGEPVRTADGLCVRVGRGEPGEAIGRVSADKDALISRFEGYTSPVDTDKKILRDVFAAGDAWVRSGDLMRIDDKGFYYFVDRIGDSFRWKGENVSTAEVAAAVCSCPGVLDAAVYGVAVPRAEGKAGMALIAAKESFDLAALAIELCDKLPPYARPLFLRVRSSLDLTPTFKRQKQDLIRDGYDPSRIRDPLFVLDKVNNAYLPLDLKCFMAIQRGAMRL
jgi:fatty-acyl-CoA synthase